MIRTGRKKEWSILLFVAFLIALLPPVLNVFDRPILIFDIPLSYLYFFGVWGLVILFTALGARRRISDDANESLRKPENGSASHGQEPS